MADETKVTVENETPEPEEIEALKAELEAERARASELVAEATAELNQRIATLEQEVASKTEGIEILKGQAREAITEYKKLAVAGNPVFTEELITGETIEEVKTSVQRANDFLAKVKETIEKQIKDESIPAGAPPRTAPDLSSLSARDKIKEGMNKAQK